MSAVGLRDVLGWVISANSHWTVTVAKAVLAGDGADIAHSDDYHVLRFHPIFLLRLLCCHVVNEGLVDCLIALEELIRVRVKSIDIGPLFVWVGRLWLSDDGLNLREKRATHFANKTSRDRSRWRLGIQMMER